MAKGAVPGVENVRAGPTVAAEALAVIIASTQAGKATSHRNLVATDAWQNADPQETLNCTADDGSPSSGWTQKALLLVNP